MIPVGIAGVTGYTGKILYSLIKQHPHFVCKQVFSESHVGVRLAEVCPEFLDTEDLLLQPLSKCEAAQCELVFLALPHGTSHVHVQSLINKGIRVIDLSADFRFSNANLYNDLYNQEHSCPELLNDSVYALPEWFSEQFMSAKLLAVPGCYPTSVLLALLPLKRYLSNTDTLIIDSKSGVSGAGKKIKPALHYCEITDSFSAYQTGLHRHEPEMNTYLEHKVLFSPHLVPMKRGIMSDCYVPMPKQLKQADVIDLYKKAYENADFVTIFQNQSSFSTRLVRNTNHCYLNIVFKDDFIVIQSVIDNLIKGASGQAVQAANCCYGFDQKLGLMLSVDL